MTLPTGTKTLEEPKPVRTQEIVDESDLNKSFPTTGTLDIARRHPFTHGEGRNVKRSPPRKEELAIREGLREYNPPVQ
ncbi:hypothetical protein VNO80_19175 [Phaseolus coccineus]|uniref:Uncharacterized protein n=1 Tax=Phaseolus coccineus TaxID=3886 RepID=A0AAN9MJ14_PHACN